MGPDAVYGRERPKPPTGPRWVFAVTIAAVVVDQTPAFSTAAPTPYASPLVLLAVLAHRAWVLRPRASGVQRSSVSP